MIESPLREINPPAKLSSGFFNSIIRRIECIKPIAGSGVKVEQTESGIKISSRELIAEGEDNPAKLLKLNVCKNGTPATIRVYGYDP